MCTLHTSTYTDSDHAVLTIDLRMKLRGKNKEHTEQRTKYRAPTDEEKDNFNEDIKKALIEAIKKYQNNKDLSDAFNNISKEIGVSVKNTHTKRVKKVSGTLVEVSLRTD